MPVIYIVSNVWVRLNIFSPLSIIQYVGLYVFSLPISVVVIEMIYILCLIIIIKSEVSTITHVLNSDGGFLLINLDWTGFGSCYLYICSDSNMLWFVVVDEALVILTECEVSQNTTGGFKECLITCTCSCAECEYLYFRVQMPPWMRRTLAICHFEQLNEYDTTELPFVVVWILNQLFPFHLLYIEMYLKC